MSALDVIRGNPMQFILMLIALMSLAAGAFALYSMREERQPETPPEPMEQVVLAATGWTDTRPSLPRHPLGWRVELDDAMVPIATAGDRVHRYCTRQGGWLGAATHAEFERAERAARPSLPRDGWAVRRIKGIAVAVSPDGCRSSWWDEGRCAWVDLDPEEPLAREAKKRLQLEVVLGPRLHEEKPKGVGERVSKSTLDQWLKDIYGSASAKMVHPPMWQQWWDQSDLSKFRVLWSEPSTLQFKSPHHMVNLHTVTA